MKFLRVDADISTVEHHMAVLAGPDPEIEVFLTRYLLVLTYAQYTDAIHAIVSLRADRIGDDSAAGFIRDAAQRLIRSYVVSELSGFLARFGDECKVTFTGRVVNTPAHVAYDRIINSRHTTAHGLGADMTFPEFKLAYADSATIFDAFADALGCVVPTPLAVTSPVAKARRAQRTSVTPKSPRSRAARKRTS
jgi:hypothetical protein